MKGFLKTTLLSMILLIMGSESKELYKSTDLLKDVFMREQDLLSKLDNVIQHFESHMLEITEKINRSKRHGDIEVVNKYLENPINSFTFLKSATEFLSYINKNLLDPLSDLKKFYEEIDSNDEKWPDEWDVEGAAFALIDIQKIYQLSIDDMIQGRVYDNQYNSLSAAECFTIGLAALEYEKNQAADIWLKKAFDMCMNRTCDSQIRADIIEHYAYSQFFNGNLRRSLELTELLLDEDPRHEISLNNKDFLLSELNDVPPAERSSKFMIYKNGKYFGTHIKLYEYACQGKLIQPKEIKQKLSCGYVHHDNPYLRIGPIKEEEAHLDPRIVIYKDIIYDSEIETLKRLSKKELTRSRTLGGVTDSIRLSKVAWLVPELREIEKLNIRMSAYTDLSSESIEPFQVVNYGLGGHYVLHTDSYHRRIHSLDVSEGDRLATLLIYMSDVDKGGETVFPALGLKVKPEKGSAVFWHNLHPNRTTNSKTVHGSCPVLIGTKWATNLWYHEQSNEVCKIRLPFKGS